MSQIRIQVISLFPFYYLNRIAVYKALYTFGGYMSDVVAAVDQVCEYGKPMTNVYKFESIR